MTYDGCKRTTAHNMPRRTRRAMTKPARAGGKRETVVMA